MRALLFIACGLTGISLRRTVVVSRRRSGLIGRGTPRRGLLGGVIDVSPISEWTLRAEQRSCHRVVSQRPQRRVWRVAPCCLDARRSASR